MNDMKYERVVVAETMTIGQTKENIWPLLCPVREYEWIPNWNCRLICTSSGFNEPGCVFQTEFPADGPVDTWVTSVYQPASRLEFIRANPLRVIRYCIELETVDDRTEMRWSQEITPLCPEGVALATIKAESFKTQIAGLESMLRYYLENRTMLEDVKE